MSDPKRFADDDSRLFERSVVRAWKGAGPSRGARNATLVALGLPAGASDAHAPNAPPARSPQGATSTAFGVAKALLVGWGPAVMLAFASTVAPTVAPTDTSVVGAPMATGREYPREVSSAEGAARSASEASGLMPAPPAPARPEGPDDPIRTAARSPTLAANPVPRPATPNVSTRDDVTPRPRPSLGEEIARLDEARALLRGGEARAALVELDAYDRAYPAGLLRPESVLVRIDALVALGDAARARRLAGDFLREHPHTPHAERLGAIAGESQTTGSRVDP